MSPAPVKPSRSRCLSRLPLAGLWIALLLAPAPLEAQGMNATCAHPAPVQLTGKSCAPLAPPEVSCTAWADVEGALKQGNFNVVQRAVDLFAWQGFLAINWPAGAVRGEPNHQADFSQGGPRVWETWKEAYEVYLPDGSAPAPWNAPQPVPAGCRSSSGEPPSKLLQRSAKVDDLLDEALQAVAADGTLPPTLKDQSGHLVRYEIRLNRPLFEYIADPESPLYSGLPLYNGIEQGKAKSIDFPLGSQLVKAAWRRIDPEEAPFFHTAEACVCNEGEDGQPRDCRLDTMGLAGFHVMTKTASAPQWIWSTFEHVDNVVSTHGAADGNIRPLNDPSCPPHLCPPNRQTALDLPTQVRRVIPIPNQDPHCDRPHQAVDNVQQLNADVQKTLEDLESPFQHYELVGAQWPIPRGEPSGAAPLAPQPAHARTRDGLPARDDARVEFDTVPALLGNTTMETFAQQTSSCMGCHAMSRTLNPRRFVSGDFSFTLNNARPRPPAALCQLVGASESCSDSILPPPRAPESPWERAHWPEILTGYRYATETYELAGPRYVGAKLHCTSCHLDGGGNRDAAWWVDMWKVYEYPETTQLQDRINGCFERSMNGHALCSTKDGPEDCAQNPVMRGLITYMQWLTDSFTRRWPDRTPCRGFPPAQVTPGDVDRGHRAYVQKCAFCHDAQGQGRYESHTYFRPALWGPDSFNACAGFNRPADLTQFLRWNMPLTSGGLLTDREASDLAAYIQAQCRPGKGGVGPDGEPCSLTPNCIDGQQPSTGADKPQGLRPTLWPREPQAKEAQEQCRAFQLRSVQAPALPDSSP